MTENKRYSFNWKSGHPNFWDNHCDLADCYLTCGDVVNILNELNDENEKLKIFLKAVNEELDLANRDCDILEEENEQLKQQIGNLEHTRDFCAECCERLEKENEELKSEIRKVQRAYEQLWEHTYK